MILAHGGTAGGLAEAAVLVVPLVILVLMLLWSRRQAAADEDHAEEADGDGTGLSEDPLRAENPAEGGEATDAP